MSTALRTSLIWHDEVMGDVVHEKPAAVTIGTHSSSTFVTPELSLPPSFSIVTPGRRGYVLTMSTTMSGTISLGGVEHDVATFVAAGEGGTGFFATPLGPDDWGVITLDETGEHKLFFQFVPHEVEDWNLGHPMILAGAAGYALSIAALTLFWWSDGVAIGEAAFRGASLASLAIGFAAIVRWAFKQNNESRASLAFSVLLHSAILLLTFQLYEKQSPAVWPGPASTTGSYLVRASDPPSEPAPVEQKQKKTVEEVQVGAATPLPMPHDRSNRLPPTTIPWEHKAKPTLPEDKKKKGGKEGPGMLAHADLLDDLAGDRGIKDVIDDLKNIDGDGAGDRPEFGHGDGPNTKGADPDGGKPGSTVGKRSVKKGDIDTGGLRAAVCFTNCGGGGGRPIDVDPPTSSSSGEPYLTKEDIAKVMVARQGLFKACFQKALDRGSTSGGDLVLQFVIDANGKVTSAGTVGGSIDAGVASCVKQKLYLLTFPKKGGARVRHFPFVFTGS